MIDKSVILESIKYYNYRTSYVTDEHVASLTKKLRNDEDLNNEDLMLAKKIVQESVRHILNYSYPPGTDVESLRSRALDPLYKVMAQLETMKNEHSN